MKKIIITGLLTLSFTSNASVEELFLKSLETSNEVKIIDLQERKTIAELDQTVTTLYPSINLVNRNQYGNESYQSKSGLKKFDSSIALSLEQKIFQGGAEFSIYKLHKIVPKKALAAKEQKLAEYFALFSSYYFQLSSALEEKREVSKLLVNLEKRVRLVRKRTKIGRDRKADLYALESQYDRLKADLIDTESKLEEARKNFLNFSGLKSAGNFERRVDPFALNLNESVDLENRPELKSLELEYETSLTRAKIEKSSYFPQVTLGSNYYLDKSYTGRDEWDVSVNLTMNIFDFGKTAASYDTQNIQALIDKTRLQYNRSNSDREWSNFVKVFNHKKSQLASLKKSLSQIKASYTEQVKDLDKGLVAQIDVIRSLDDVINLEKLYIKAALELKSLYYQSKAYLGEYPKK
ncbi:putative oter membrane protein [Halobacteriovorax marinus SJ]|uniref:Oter membrane protein n=1 Tax=Halobacteriovorax marinus (strain ATCC BAA-682 / DSM 15412 / SJ) TaxID=862908 RepID=E1X426_HALMS|nr:TolC family protein [Halobacteriovorax marinus]CBW25366.1 putative oter membrane protein [Halobacteriovorax marinus SJ]